jgi:hypothetical protein
MAVALAGPQIVQWPGFSGLNLRDQPNQIDPTQALDLLNVTLIERGGVKSRDGYAKFTSVGADEPPGLARRVLHGRRHDAARRRQRQPPRRAEHGGGERGERRDDREPALLRPVRRPDRGADVHRERHGHAAAVERHGVLDPGVHGDGADGPVRGGDAVGQPARQRPRSGATLGDNPSTVRFSDAGVPTTFGPRTSST